MRKLILLLPLLALILQCDKLLDQPAAPPAYTPERLMEALEALPARTEGRYGKQGTPLNFVFLGSEADVRRAMTAAGWTSLPVTIAESLRLGALDVWQGRKLTHFPPMQGYRLMDRYQDINWVNVVSLQSRHHFRLWRTGVLDKRGRQVWWGTGDFDEKLRLWDLTHVPNPSMDLERKWVQDSLEGSEHVEKMTLVALKQIPLKGVNDNRYAFTTDGRALLVELKPASDVASRD